MPSLKEIEKEAELSAFLCAAEKFGLTLDGIAAELSIGAQRSLTELDVRKVFEGSQPVPASWWRWLRAYERRVLQRQKILTLESQGSRFGSVESGVFTVDFESAFDREAAARAILAMPERSRAFVVHPSFWRQG